MVDQPIVASYRPTLRLPIRFANSVFALLDRLRSKIAFATDREAAIRIASTISGVSDFDCEELGEPLQMLCDTISDPRMTPMGRLQRKVEIILRVTNRLYIEKALRADPDIEKEPIEKPWFVMGLPRTGTTLLHRLLAQDPQHRAPLMWEGMAAFPRGPHDTARRRINKVKVVTRFSHYLAPELRAKHELGAELPEECKFLLANSVLGTSLMGATEKFNDWFWALDKTRAYQLHKLQLQYLQRNSLKKTWILKDPDHLLNLEWLLKVYPDARIIKLHRNPIEVLPSAASLLATLESAFLREVNMHGVGRNTCDYAKRSCYSPFNTKEGTDNLVARGVRFVDIRYTDLIADPLTTVAGIYANFGHEFTEDAQHKMSSYLQQNSQQRHGAHRYTLEKFGLGQTTIRAEFDSYVDQFVTRPYQHSAGTTI